MESVRDKVLAYIREQGLLKPGDRVGTAVSGGADSVGLLQLLLELRSDLGIVLSVLHFNHKLRGTEAEGDEKFVADLAREQRLPFHSASADIRTLAAERKQSLETTGREARYRFFESFFHGHLLDVVATGHTMDDQAETVLMRVLRGAGTKGMGGIFPVKRIHGGPGVIGRIVRPLLGVRRSDVRAYLQCIGSSWREDATNADLQYTRNRIRHGLLPLIETRFKPNAVPALAHLAEVSREEEGYWQAEIARVLPAILRRSANGFLSLEVAALLATRPAFQRRIMRHCGQLAGLTLDFEHLEQVLRLLRGGSGKECELPGGWVALRELNELRFEPILRAKRAAANYEYRLTVPGEVEVREIGAVVRAFLRPIKTGSSCCPGGALDRRKLGTLVVRNWRPGDRLWPAHSKAPKKIKELLQGKRVAMAERRSWPVVASGESVVWARGFGASSEFGPECDSREAVVIEEHVPANLIAGE